MQQHRFKLRTLILITFICACFASLVSTVIRNRQMARQAAGLGMQKDPEHWPHVLRKLIGTNHTLRKGLTPCGLTAGFDQSSIWKLESDAPMIEFLIEQAKLAPTNSSHPIASILVDSLPEEWPAQDWDTSQWFATPGFGVQHIEGPDLFLLAIDSESGAAIVYHENHF